MAAENYSDVVQALAKQIVDTCMKALKQNIQGLVRGVSIDASQITGDIVATDVRSDITVTPANIQGLNQYVSDMIAGSTIDITQIATVGEDGKLHLNDVYINSAQIADLEAQYATLWTAQIGKAEIQTALVEVLQTKLAEIANAQIQTANIDVAQIRDLSAAVADIATAEIGQATIGYAQIEGLSAGQALITQGVGGKLYIADLAVTEANMVNLTVGQLVVKGLDGKYYQITVSTDEQGHQTIGATEAMQLTGANIADGAIDGSTKIIENSITASRLNVDDIFANNAMILRLIAQNINTDELFANTAFINKLNAADISSNTSLQLAITDAVDDAEDSIMEEVAIRLSDQSIISTVTGSTAFQNQVKEASAPVLKIDSSRGTVFKSNNVATVLTVTVFHGSTVITNRTQLTAEFGAAAYLRWQYLPYGSESTDQWREMLNTDSHISNDGFTLTLTPGDVDTKITFRCLLEQTPAS